jgi:N-acyl homoserine lactone hydrolase
MSTPSISAHVHRFWALDAPIIQMPMSLLIVGGEGMTDSPFPSFLIEHTPGELVLIDTGLRPQAAEDPVGAYGDLGAHLLPDGYPRHLAVDRQLGALGFKPADIKTVIITHLHIDHTGAMPLFQHAQFIGGQGEMRFALWPDPVQEDAFYIKDDFGFLAERRSQWTEVGPQDHDVFGDGSVVLYHLPGHTPGQLAVLVRTREQNILLAADVVHVREGLGGKPMPNDWSAEHTARSVERLKLIAAANDARIWVGHDEGDWAAMKHAPAVYD